MKKIKGFLAVEFALVFTLLLFFLAHFMLLAFTLTQIFITQYISFSMARQYFAGHHTEEKQKIKAQEVYDELRPQLYIHREKGGQPFGAEIKFDKDSSNHIGSFHPEPIDAGLFDGIQLKFITRMIQMNIPFIDDGETAKETEFTIGSYIGREPTRDECRDFFRVSKREVLEDIMEKATQVKMPSYLTEDNGC